MGRAEPARVIRSVEASLVPGRPMGYDSIVLRARGAKGSGQAEARRADRVAREITPPPVFGKENEAYSRCG